MPAIECLARAKTAIGELVLQRFSPQASPEDTFLELLVDGRMLMSDYNTVSERALAREGVARSEGERLRVLVGGLGLGHTAHEALASSRVAKVDVVEFVPEVADWFERELITLAPAMREDSRLEVIMGDVYAQLLGPAATRYDLLLVDVDHAPDDPLPGASAPFYTVDGLRRVTAHLTPGGMLAVWSCADNELFEATLREVFASVSVERTVFEDDLFGSEDEHNWLFFASDPMDAPRTEDNR